jgi:hypothetical protein
MLCGGDEDLLSQVVAGRATLDPASEDRMRWALQIAEDLHKVMTSHGLQAWFATDNSDLDNQPPRSYIASRQIGFAERRHLLRAAHQARRAA